MIEIPFTKLHGAENDFLLTWGDDARVERSCRISPAAFVRARPESARTVGCWFGAEERGGLVRRLFNSDGSEPEISGNGTRCAAAFAISKGGALPPDIRITTAAGPKDLRLISHTGQLIRLRDEYGPARMDELRAQLHLAGAEFDASILNVGNPQCAIFVEGTSRKLARLQPGRRSGMSAFRTALMSHLSAFWTGIRSKRCSMNVARAKPGVLVLARRARLSLLFSGM